MLSPSAAPRAATRMISSRFGDPADTAMAAAATTTVSLGTGGKKPSMTTARNTTA